MTIFYKQQPFHIIIALCFLLSFDAQSAIKKPSFHTSMCITPQYIPKRAENDPLWQKIIHFYDRINFKQNKGKSYKIPPIIHHIWLGSELPPQCKQFRQSWIEKHPTWTHILWTDNKINYDDTALILLPESFDEVVTFLNQTRAEGQHIVIDIEHLSFQTYNQYIHSPNYGEKSDILRYEILFYIGGLYVDTDFKCLYPFDELHKTCTFFAGLNFSDEDFNVFNGLIGAQPLHPICKRCKEEIRKQSLNREEITHAFKDAKIAIMERTGPYFFSRIIRDYIMDATIMDRIVLFPVTFFYPYPHLYIGRHRKHSIQQIEDVWLKPESLAIHFWHVSWDPQKTTSNAK